MTDDATRVVPSEEPAGAGETRLVRAQATGLGASGNRVPEAGVGDTIKGRYELLERIGVGGMGVVYRARDLRLEEAQDRNPYVALKVLSAEFAQDSRMMVALQREARKAQRLAHPNVITVYNYDREDDTVFLTMELLDGQTLDELVEAHPNGLPREQALDMIRGMCLGLAYAHNRGIVHSDFKAGNVFYTTGGETRILDFGIARAMPRSSHVEASDQTAFDVGTLGALTPSYASPEMLNGQEPKASDDVFALAIVAYQLLTGQHPFDFAPASEARERALVPRQTKGMSRREWRAIKAGLAFDGASRPADAAAFLRLLEGTSPFKKVALAACVALVLTVAYVAYDRTTEVMAQRPDVAFENLPADAQQRFRELLQEGSFLEEYEDFNGALDRYRRAYEMHPRNGEAVAALERLVGKIRRRASSFDDPRSLRDAREQLESLRSVDEFLASRTVLQQAVAALR